MSDTTLSIKFEMLRKIDEAWKEIETYLAGLTEAQMIDFHDDQGWNVRDHITHMAAWEESVAMLFHRVPRYQTLGIDPVKYSTRQLIINNIDEVNASIRARLQNVSSASALEEFRRIHQLLMMSLGMLSDADLNQTTAGFFPPTLSNDERRLLALIESNTSDHYIEHLPWIKTLVSSAR